MVLDLGYVKLPSVAGVCKLLPLVSDTYRRKELMLARCKVLHPVVSELKVVFRLMERCVNNCDNFFCYEELDTHDPDPGYDQPVHVLPGNGGFLCCVDLCFCRKCGDYVGTRMGSAPLCTCVLETQVFTVRGCSFPHVIRYTHFVSSLQCSTDHGSYEHNWTIDL
jgi:hypothetical protein